MSSSTLMEGGICLLAWKRRTGLLANYFLPTERQWEQRWIVLSGHHLAYFALGEEDGDPRGSVDLTASRAVQITVSSRPSPDAPTPHEMDIVVTSSSGTTTATGTSSTHTTHNSTSTTSTATHSPTRTPPSSNTATAASKHATTANNSNNNNNISWKFCFHTQQDLMQFLETAHRIQDAAGHYEGKDAARFEHDFAAGDHLYRWEMICCPPVIYPIQIHGIVLEAGRNCVVVADFGLTGYGRKEGSEFNHADDHTSNAILAAFKKLRPGVSTDQRLNIVTLTDPMEIRKWHKANYEEGAFFAPHDNAFQFNKLSKFLSKLSSKPKKKKASKDGDVDDEDGTDRDISLSQSRDSEYGDDLFVEEANNNKSTMLDTSESSNRSSKMNSDSKQQQQQPPLPKSDPVPIVLARANYLLEHEDVLPPYHVFYSNSECIAVWCKTGRWSTLQTAVFLSTTSVGGAKSATLATMGVAAAHALLAPVVAVGGLVWVTAPMIVLQKSRVKWQEATEQLTERFWAWAPPRVYVSAIENWSGLCHDDTDDNDKNDGNEKAPANQENEQSSKQNGKFEAVDHSNSSHQEKEDRKEASH